MSNICTDSSMIEELEDSEKYQVCDSPAGEDKYLKVCQNPLQYLTPVSPAAIIFYLDEENELCRICLNPGSIPIFGSDDISDDIKHFAGIDLSPNDCLPQHLCANCQELLNSAVNFRRIAIKSDIVLRKGTEDFQSQDSQSAVDKINTDEHTEELSDAESSKHSVYLEYGNVKSSDIESESFIDETNSFNDTLSIPETIEPDPEELKELVTSLNKNCKFPRCEICDLTFRTMEQINEHSLSHDLKHIVSCEVCKNIIHKNLYSIHLKLHRESFNQRVEKIYKKIECTVCGKRVSKSYMKRHMTNHHDTDMSMTHQKCTICAKSFNINYMAKHMKKKHFQSKEKTIELVYNKAEKIICPICSRMIKESIYNAHVASHAVRKKKYVCEECGKEMFTKSTFATHLLIHKDEYKYKCQFCPYLAKHLGLLKVHVRTHTKVYPYKCLTCDACFISKSNLNAHERRHSGVKYQCPDCVKCFTTTRSLQIHKVSVHEGIKAFSCNLCEKKYGNKDVMIAHRKRVHHESNKLSRVGRTPSYLLAAKRTEDAPCIEHCLRPTTILYHNL